MTKSIVVWSPEADRTYIETISNILENWPISSAEKFEQKVEELITHLEYFRHIAPKSKNRNLRKLIVTKQTSLIYIVKDANLVELVAFIPNRSQHKY
jgi:plasmid stabilization system protein ParE